ncbi:hypothetical protein thsps21_60600 [Pseudomonas sp. No.21]|uniref:hypothetical protein n=1 Tax=Pseudomonas TaxID=286 RepID=UPI0011B38212|nr:MULTISPECIES: hypothetical protein [Pseudomonas]MDW3714085.1 hypothetical protein [Pseudomonas sp. 2023EL-01195]GJN50208.1 hypothetical protein TUM20249_61940 [Pseudomonas tohonis]
MSQFSRVDLVVAALYLLVSQTGCAQLMNQDLSPPSVGETVSVSVKVPKDLVANTMRVMYRSEKCPITRSDGSGGRYKIDGAKAIEVEPQRQGMTDIYEAKLAKDGGGFCEWKLSNVTFGIHFGNTEQFGEKVDFSGGGEVVVIFDNNLPQQQSMYGARDVDGDVLISEDYFPWLSKIFLNGERSVIELYGSQSFLTFKSLSARKVVFQPRYHADLLVRTIGVKAAGGAPEVVYPDGSRQLARSRPNINRLKEIAADR